MTPDKTEKRKAFVISFAYFALLAGIVLFIFKYLMPMFAPFLIGFLLAALLAPLIRLLSSKWKLKRSLAAVFLLIAC